MAAVILPEAVAVVPMTVAVVLLAVAWQEAVVEE